MLKFLFLALGILPQLLGCAIPTRPRQSPESAWIEQRNSAQPIPWKTRYQALLKLQNFILRGKIGFSDGNQGGNASVVWEQHPHQYDLRFYGPIGSESIQIKGLANQITLIHANGQKEKGRSPEELIRSVWGYEIPVSGLLYWVRGLPIPNKKVSNQNFDNYQRLINLQQEGWLIEYRNYKPEKSAYLLELPHHIVLKNGRLKIKLILKHWESDHFSKVDKPQARQHNGG